MVNVIFLAGCERSGTNYIQWLLKENFKDTIIITLWKHYAPRNFIPHLKWDGSKQDEKLLNIHKKDIDKFIDDISFIGPGLPPFAFVSTNNTITITEPKRRSKRSISLQNIVRETIENGTMQFLINIKNPYGWHLSYTKHWSKYKFPQYMRKWNDTHTEWVKFENKFPESTMFVRHEDALKDFKKELDKIKNKFNMIQSREKYITVEDRLTTTTDTYKEKYSRKEYFENELYIDEIIKTHKKGLEDCRKDLSEDLMNRFGYRIL